MKSILSITLKISILAIVLTYLPVDLAAQITVTDIDGNVYNTVAIGNQLWLKENLKVAHYRNGEAIPNVTDGTAWAALTSDAQCDYNNFVGNNIIYGKLYNHFAVLDSRHLCPLGWHVPSKAEFETLVTFLGGENFAGGKLKETGTLHWNQPNQGANNESEFTALAAGFRWHVNGVFAGMSQTTKFWASTNFNADEAYTLQLFYDSEIASVMNSDKNEGFSVRCVCDYPAGFGMNFNSDDDFLVWPNPFSDMLYYSSANDKPSNIRIYDSTGKCVFEKRSQTLKDELNLRHLPDGIYLLSILNSETNSKRILIKGR